MLLKSVPLKRSLASRCHRLLKKLLPLAYRQLPDGTVNLQETPQNLL